MTGKNLIGKWTEKMWFVYRIVLVWPLKWKKILPFGTIWINLEDIKLRKII